jgi:hypothetical protein
MSRFDRKVAIFKTGLGQNFKSARCGGPNGQGLRRRVYTSHNLLRQGDGKEQPRGGVRNNMTISEAAAHCSSGTDRKPSNFSIHFLMKQTRSIAKTGSGQTTQRDVKTEACFCNIDRTAVGGGFLPTLANKAEEDHMVSVVKSECSSSSSDDVAADGSGPTIIPLGLMVKKRAF